MTKLLEKYPIVVSIPLFMITVLFILFMRWQFPIDGSTTFLTIITPEVVSIMLGSYFHGFLFWIYQFAANFAALMVVLHSPTYKFYKYPLRAIGIWILVVSIMQYIFIIVIIMFALYYQKLFKNK